MADDEKGHNEITSGELVRAGLEDKVKSIGGYEDIIWKIRSGYIVLLYGALTFILGKEGKTDICEVITPMNKALPIFSLILGLSLSVFLIDVGYVRKRLKVVVARDRLIELACSKHFDVKKESKEILRLLHVAGETAPSNLPDGLVKEYREKLWWNIFWILLPIYLPTPFLAVIMHIICPHM